MPPDPSDPPASSPHVMITVFFTHTYLLKLSLPPRVCCHFIIVVLHFLRASSCLPTGLAHLFHKSGFFFRFCQPSCLLTGLWRWCRPQAAGVCTFLHHLCQSLFFFLLKEASKRGVCTFSHHLFSILYLCHHLCHSLFYSLPQENIRSLKEGGVHILTRPFSLIR